MFRPLPDPVLLDLDRHLSYEDRDTAAEEREWREMDPNLRSLAETLEGMGFEPVKQEENE